MCNVFFDFVLLIVLEDFVGLVCEEGVLLWLICYDEKCDCW